jgi:dihydroxyacid dehydratase/phosphogluconate dehydratase
MADIQEPFGPLRSSMRTKGVNRATHRFLLYFLGWRSEHLDKPLVAVANSFNELLPGHIHRDSLTPAAFQNNGSRRYSSGEDPSEPDRRVARAAR